MTEDTVAVDSTWHGTTSRERSLGRRERLLAAGRAVFARDGAAGVTVRAVTRESGLSPRFFYESFADRDALLLAVWDELYEEVSGRVESVAGAAPADFDSQLTAAVEATGRWFDDEPARAFMMLAETLADRLLREHARLRLPEFILSVLADSLDPRALMALDPTRLRIALVALTGAILNLFLERSLGDLELTPAELAAVIVQLMRGQLGDAVSD